MNNYFVIWILLPVILLTGCAIIQDTAKGIAGVSTKELQEGRKDAIVKQFDYGYNTCFNKVKKTLTLKGSYLYAQSMPRHMIALYVSEEDTTPVGIFFKEIGTNKTQIEITSASKYAKEFIAKRLQNIDERQDAPKEVDSK